VPRSYAPEFRRRVVGLVRSGRPVAENAAAVDVSKTTVYRWMAPRTEGRTAGRSPRLTGTSTLARARPLRMGTTPAPCIGQRGH
jgi:transposase-like protein